MNKKVFIIASPLETDHATEILGYPIIYSGIGKINATIATMKAYNLGYNTVINIGSCGSTKYSAGELIAIGKVYQDIDLTPLTLYGNTLFETNSQELIVEQQLGHWRPIISNKTCFTTDYFYDVKQRSKYSDSYLRMIDNSDIIDMECYAIAKVCNQFNMQFSSYKWVSDDGNATSWEKNCQIGLEKVKKQLATQN